MSSKIKKNIANQNRDISSSFSKSQKLVQVIGN